MNIILTNIKENKLYIFFENPCTFNKVYIDTPENFKNIELPDFLHNQIIELQYNSIRSLAIDLNDIDMKACVFTIVSDDQEIKLFSYDPKYLYDLQKNIMFTQCDTCDIKQHKTKILIVIYRLMLFTYSFLSELLEDTVDNYINLMRILDSQYVPKYDCFYKSLNYAEL